MTGSYFSGEWNARTRDEKNARAFLALGPPLCLYDLGASGGAPPPFSWIPEGVRLVNFEPDRRATTEASGRTCDCAIGPKNLTTLYVNRRQTTSSLLLPCAAVVGRYDFARLFPEEPRIFETVATVQVETLGLDEAIEALALPAPDFLKIDVQGLTYEVLRTGGNALRDAVLGLQAEVEFVESYTGQKTFGAVHEHLEQSGFELFRVSNLNRWTFKTAMPLSMRTGQDVFCDLLYLRSLRHVERGPGFWTADRIVQFLRICLLYDLTDTAAAYLERFIGLGLIDARAVEELAAMIGGWKGALEYFFRPGWGRGVADGRGRQFRQGCALLIKSLLPKRLATAISAARNG